MNTFSNLIKLSLLLLAVVPQNLYSKDLTTGKAIFNFSEFSSSDNFDSHMLNKSESEMLLDLDEPRLYAVVASPPETPTSFVGENPELPTSENTRQMSTALNSEGKRVFTAYATKLNASHDVVVHDRNGNIVPLGANVPVGTLFHLFDKPLIFIKKPGSDSQYFLITQVSGASDFLYRHTLDASLPGNGTLEEPLGEIIETNHLLYTNNNAMRYGVSVHAIQNAGENNTTWMYFLRSSATQVQLTAQVLNSNGSFGSSISPAPVTGTPIGRIKFSPDGRQLLFAYLPPAVVNQVQLAVIRRFAIGPNGELSQVDQTTVSKTLLDFEFSPDGKYIYYAHTISETPQVKLKGANQKSGNKFQVRRWHVITRNDEFVGNSYNDEIFNGKHLAFQRSSNGKMYISAAGHRRMMVINDLDSDIVPVLSGEAIADNDPTKAPYLSGAFATTAFDHHFHAIHTNGTFYAARNKRQYELKDHLENVNVVVSDLRAADGSASVVSANNYYPYGMMMPGRNYNSADYRYGFNGKEKDDELKGSGNSYDFGARLYDPRVGQWLTRDPLAAEFAGWSDYNAFADNPILNIDPDGRKFVNAFDQRIEHQKTIIEASKADFEKKVAAGMSRWRARRKSGLNVAEIKMKLFEKGQKKVDRLLTTLKNSNEEEYRFFEGLKDMWGNELTIEVDIVDGENSDKIGIGGDTDPIIEPETIIVNGVEKRGVVELNQGTVDFRIRVFELVSAGGEQELKRGVPDDQLFGHFSNELGDVKFFFDEWPKEPDPDLIMWNSGKGSSPLYNSNTKGAGHYSREYQKARENDLRVYNAKKRKQK